MIDAMPSIAPFPESNFFNLTSKEKSDIGVVRSENLTDKILPCSIPVRVGLFFDGTNNNMERDRDGRRIGLLDQSTGKREKIKDRPLDKNQRSHTNIARLFMTFPIHNKGDGNFSYYMPGVGTPFNEIGEVSESDKGKAFGWGGQARIIWALFQVINAIHMTASGDLLLFTPKMAGELARSYDKEVGIQRSDNNDDSVKNYHQNLFYPHLEKLKSALISYPKPNIPSITLSVFGFSRGAAEAVAFCHIVSMLLEGGRFSGIPLSIDFLGVFDTVASVGISASAAKMLMVPGVIFDGYMSWAAYLLKPLPDCISAGLHCVAAHEQRMNFPVTKLSGNIAEQYFLGVHSDVGGGYAPGDQGRGRDLQSAMLSQIPLAYMYKAARLAGVPLTPYNELVVRVKDDFGIDASLASAWNAYALELGANGALLKGHMALYYQWRAARLNSMSTTASYKATDNQAQLNMREANDMLRGDLEALDTRRMPFEWQRNPRGMITNRPLPASARKRMNKWHYDAAQIHKTLDEWEVWALTFFDHLKPLPSEVMRFFDDYVHDSFAGFCLAGAVTEYDKRVVTDASMKKNAAQRGQFEQRVYDIAAETKRAQAKKSAGETLTEDEERLVRESDYGTPFPLMSDADSAEMGSKAVEFLSNSRREGGGYIIRRGYYPHNGWIRVSVNEAELERAPQVAPPKDEINAGPPTTLIWSDDVLGELLALNEPDASAVEKANATA